jgi:hypothetical protein
LYLEYNGITGVGLEALARGVSDNLSLTTLGLWGNEWDVDACQAFAPIIGGSVRENNVGEREDMLPEKLCAVMLKDLHVKSNDIILLDAKSWEKSFDPTIKPRSVSTAPRLKNHDFVIYSVEKVLRVAKKDF